MPRIRSLKPEAPQHRKVGRLTVPARWLWVVMITQADDDGRLIADPGQLRVMAFPYDRDVTDEQVAALLSEIARLGLVRLYEANGIPCAYFPSWNDHQRIHRNHYTPSKLPPPPSPDESGQVRDMSRTGPGPTRDVFGTSTGQVPLEGKGGDRKGKETTSLGADAPRRAACADAPGFEEWFWPLYPKKVSKADALKAWNRLRPDHALQAQMRSGLETHAKSDDWTRDRGQFIPYPATWLNRRRWEDEGTVVVTARAAAAIYLEPGLVKLWNQHCADLLKAWAGDEHDANLAIAIEPDLDRWVMAIKAMAKRSTKHVLAAQGFRWLAKIEGGQLVNLEAVLAEEAAR